MQRRFRVNCFGMIMIINLTYPNDGHSKHLSNVSTILPDYTSSHTRQFFVDRSRCRFFNDAACITQDTACKMFRKCSKGQIFWNTDKSHLRSRKVLLYSGSACYHSVIRPLPESKLKTSEFKYTTYFRKSVNLGLSQ